MPRTYTVITPEMRTPITTCQQLLPNGMQCWKPGSVLITEPAVMDDDTVVTPSTQYQLCKAHATILWQTEQQTSAIADSIAANAKRGELLKQEMEQQQTTPPRGEDSPNNQ